MITKLSLNGIVNKNSMSLLGAGELFTTGNVYYVDSGAGSNDNVGTDPAFPKATLDGAINACTANNGDTIVLMPGHAESIIAAAGADFDIAGIKVVGLGTGTDRPTITFTTATTADIDFDAANIHIENVVFINDIDALAAPLDVNAANVSFVNCEFRDDTAAKQTVRWILADANGDYLKVYNSINKGSDTAGAIAFITLTGSDHVELVGNSSHGDFSAANIQVLTTAVTDVLISGNHLENANAVNVNIEGVAASTGWVSNNSCRIATDTITTWINIPGAMSLFENYGVNNAGETGKLIGVVSV